ncbi:hypothetical protein Ddc_21800 [Ditylenchus destructor]|nr:hypothetical protein Ddc_21800 [Ditylenchus destructor]
MACDIPKCSPAQGKTIGISHVSHTAHQPELQVREVSRMQHFRAPVTFTAALHHGAQPRRLTTALAHGTPPNRAKGATLS